MLNGAPSEYFYQTDLKKNPDTTWNIITNALNNKYNIGADTPSKTIFGLAKAHAHTVIGAFTLKDTNGKVAARLLRIRNPWAKDVYTGPWNDADSKWTAAFKAQVPYAKDANDGGFYIDVSDFVNGFTYFSVNYVHDNWAHSKYEVLNDNGA